jgi:predicted enzyme related to lactoylglutathione lyase
MSNNINMAVWFEIPATQFERAVAFYQTVFDIYIEPFEMAGLKQGLLPHDDKSLVSGAIVCGTGYAPSQTGSVVYLNGGDDLAVALAKVEPAGGQIIMPKTHLGDEIGYTAHFIDTEGNRVGIHSL